jgi:hypothetical protein
MSIVIGFVPDDWKQFQKYATYRDVDLPSFYSGRFCHACGVQVEKKQTQLISTERKLVGIHSSLAQLTELD